MYSLVWLVACGPERTADRWLAAVAEGEDGAAFRDLGVDVAPPGGFDPARFTKRVDRLHLRDVAPVTWAPHRGWGLWPVALAGVGADQRPVSLVVRDRQVVNVRVGDQPLVPDQRYVIVPLPPPGPLPLADLRATPSPRGLRVEGVAPAGALTVRARCRVDGVWIADATLANVDGAFGITVDVPPSPPCQLGFDHLAGGTPSAAVACLTDSVRPRPCAEAPTPDPARAPVSVSAVSAAWSRSGVSVDYRLRVEVPQPAHGAFESAVVTTTLTCPGGVRPVVHTRPIDDTWTEPGVERQLGSPMAVHAEGRPCALALDYARDDHYDRLELSLWRGCVAADGATRPGGCG